MALSFGWKANDQRESIWIDDPAIPRTDPDAKGKTKAAVPQTALDAWRQDGDASHIEQYATQGKPTIIRFRALNADEKPIVLGPASVADSQIEGLGRSLIRCFRIAVSFDGMEETTKLPTGETPRLTVKEHGVRMLALEVVDDLATRYPGMIEFYGNLVMEASFLTDAEKKASSPPSTPTPSSAEASTAATTAPSPAPEAATGAP